MSRYAAGDYADAARALLPRGRVWSTGPDSVQGALLDGLAQTFARSDTAATALADQALPGSNDDLLPEWEETLGLPDPCLGPNPTLQQRRDQVRARFTLGGGQSAQRYIDFAATLGFTISIEMFAPFRAGMSVAGDPVAGDAWAHTWRVTILSSAVSDSHAEFVAGDSVAGDPLGTESAGHTVLECELRALAPAHTVLLFRY